MWSKKDIFEKSPVVKVDWQKICESFSWYNTKHFCFLHVSVAFVFWPIYNHIGGGLLLFSSQWSMVRVVCLVPLLGLLWRRSQKEGGF